MKDITGYGKCNKWSDPNGDSKQFLDDLNQFYGRFDNHGPFHDPLYDQLCEDLASCINDKDRILLTTTEVQKVLKNVKPNKAAGPDGISGRILKTCCKELAGDFRQLFQLSLDCHTVPKLWKASIIAPIPKISKPTVLNDYRPISLTAIVMKCFEQIVRNVLLTETQDFSDPFQFAYRANRSVSDALIIYLHNIYGHLDKPKTYVRTLFIDFSSAFNTIKPHVLLCKLQNMNINPHLALWINNF